MPPLSERVLSVLGRPDLQPLAASVTVRPSPGLGHVFSAREPGQILVDPDAGQGLGPALIDLRHALELATLPASAPSARRSRALPRLGTTARLDREINDALAALAKIGLILRHLDRPCATDPAATFS